MKQLKNILDLKIIQNSQNTQLGLIFYTNIILLKNKKASNINKITTIAYLSFLKNIDNSLIFQPKFPNLFTVFNSINELDNSTILNAVFIKIKNIFCFYKKSSLLFFMNESVFFFFFLLLNLFIIFYFTFFFFLQQKKFKEFT